MDLGRLIERADGDFASQDAQQLRQDFSRFMMRYKFGMEEIVTKLSILRDEFGDARHNPIEHISSRLKKRPSRSSRRSTASSASRRSSRSPSGSPTSPACA